jgi:hypothetical protein
MAGQTAWGSAGDTTNAYIVNPQKDTELYYKAAFPTLVGRISAPGGIIAMPHGARVAEIDLPGTAVIREKSIRTGNEIRLTFVDDPSGMFRYGDSAVAPGDYQMFKHVAGFVNQIDSKAMPIPGRCSLKQVNDILSDPKNMAIADRLRLSGEEMDYEFIRAILRGMSRNLLAATSEGGLYRKQYQCGTGGLQRSCYNFYGANGGFATQSVVQATYEDAVATLVSALSDNALYAFSMAQHRKMVEAIKIKKLRPVTFGGKAYSALCLIDPDLLWRLSTESAYTTLFAAAAARGMDNPAINHMNPIELDGVLYIPYERMKAFRPTVVSSSPVYGAANDYDPRTYANTSKVCLAMYLGADAVLRGTDKKIWTTPMASADGKSWQVFCSWDDGFTRVEPHTEDDRTATMDNNHSIVGAWYDAGVGVSPAA